MTVRPFLATVMFLGTVVSAQTPAPSQQTTAPPAPAGAPTQPAPGSCPEMAAALTTMMRSDVRLRDFADMARYRELNRSLAAPTGARVVSNEEIQGNLASMSELAHAHSIKVVFSSVTPVSEYHVANPRAVPQTTARPMERIRALNDWMKSYAAAHGDIYLDYFSAMTDDRGLMKTELTEDDLHPNAKGYEVMAPLAEEAIARALK